MKFLTVSSAAKTKSDLSKSGKDVICQETLTAGVGSDGKVVEWFTERTSTEDHSRQCDKKKSEILAWNDDSYLKIKTLDFRIMGYFLKLMSLSWCPSFCDGSQNVPILKYEVDILRKHLMILTY